MTQVVSAEEIRAAGGLAKWLINEARNPSPPPVTVKKMEKTEQPQRKTKRKKRVSEHEEQARLIEHCKKHEAKYPGLELLHAVPNGGHRHPAVAAKLKAEGVKAGVPDLFLPVPRGNAHGLYIELKAKGGKVSNSQRKMLAALARQGYACVVAYGWEKAWVEIEAYIKGNDAYVFTGMM